MRFLSQMYAFMYWSKRHSFLGIAVSTWLILLPFALFVLGLLFSRSLFLSMVGLALAVGIFLAYGLAKRVGYKRFVIDPTMTLDKEFAAPKLEQRVPLRATGVFSVKDHEDYVLEHPAEYWRVPLGQHVFMVQHKPGRYLYQIVEPHHIHAVEPGYLIFGREPQKALALRFMVSWGPDFGQETRFYYAGDPGQEEHLREERTIYFTFDHDADRYAVWRSLLQPNNQMK